MSPCYLIIKCYFRAIESLTLRVNNGAWLIHKRTSLCRARKFQDSSSDRRWSLRRDETAGPQGRRWRSLVPDESGNSREGARGPFSFLSCLREFGAWEVDSQ